MKICVRKKDNLVVFYGNELELTDKMIKGKDFICYDYNSKNSEILEVKSLPDNFLCDCYEYINGCFNITEYGKVEVERIKNIKYDLEIEIKRQSLLNDIISLELQVTARRRDEAMLSGDYSFIADIRKQIEAKRNELPVQPEYPEGS